MQTPVQILTIALAQRHLAYVAASEMQQILDSLGLTLNGGARQNAEDHIANHRAAGADYVLKQITPRTD